MIFPEALIQKFELEPHPEGGFYKRTYTGEKNAFSSILFLLLKDNFSAFHRIRSDEQWNWYSGDAILIHEIDPAGNYIQTDLSGQKGKENYQYVVKGGNWFACECTGENGFALCGCTVIPAFDFSDFQLGKREELILQFPQHANIIQQFTRQ